MTDPQRIDGDHDTDVVVVPHVASVSVSAALIPCRQIIPAHAGLIGFVHDLPGLQVSGVFDLPEVLHLLPRCVVRAVRASPLPTGAPDRPDDQPDAVTEMIVPGMAVLVSRPLRGDLLDAGEKLLNVDAHDHPPPR